jgi:peptide/nickel transport system substrate-binding protein
MENKTERWWDKLGTPQYGGEMIIRSNRNIVSFDPSAGGGVHMISAWMERLVADDWTLDPDIFDYKPLWHPSKYLKGQLAESWEFTNPETIVFHLRKGIHWQDIPPACGREFVADDVVFHFNRAAKAFQDLKSVTAPDKYTVVFNWQTSNPEFIMGALMGIGTTLCIENPEAVKKWGDVRDWHHAIGTGPFILRDFIPGSSATLTRNPNYWGHDERYPQNKLPYIDTVKHLHIPDDAEALAAMRAGKIDIIDCVPPVQAQEMRKTNPEILQILTPLPPTISLDPRIDVAPFNDIRVRKAMQMAIDLPTIAKSYYQGTVEPYPDTLSSRYMKKWDFGFPYEEWPQDLKDEYAYNPTKARQLLADAGYPRGFKTNIVADTAGDMNVLEIVKSYFAQIGIDMEIRKMETNAWEDFIHLGKHDQLVHHPAGHLGHTSAPLTDLNRFRSSRGYAMTNDPLFDDFYARTKNATSLDEALRIFRDANEYVARLHIAISVLQPMAYSLCQPWVKGFNAQFGSTWGAAGGPGMLSFYLGRFWIDQNLKKSMGH